MGKLTKDERLKIYYEIDDLQITYCQECEFHSDNNFCKSYCKIGGQLKKLGDKLSNLKPVKNTFISIDKEECVNFLLTGNNMNAAVEKFSVSRETIRTRMKKWGYQYKGGKWEKVS